MQESIGLRVNRVDNGEIKQLHAIVSSLPATRCKEFYLQKDQGCDYSFTITLTDAAQVTPTLTLISEVVEEKRIEIIDQ